jgi:lycopene cyclase domain-containing protein
MFGAWSYMAMLLFVMAASWWLELAFKIRVLRNPVRTLTTVALVAPWFVIWDAYAIAQGHWFFSPELTLGIYGPLGIPLEEYLFFVLIPIAAILTLEGTSAALKLVRPYLQRIRERA